MTDETNNINWKGRIFAILLGVFAIVLTIAAIQLVGYLFDLLRVNTGVPVTTIEREQTLLEESIEKKKDKNEEIIHRISFTPPTYDFSKIGNPYDNYEKNSKQLALIGKFKSAKLIIKGKIDNEKEHFLSINVGNESGVYNGVRSTQDQLNTDLTRENFGIFTKDTGLELVIDLMAPQTLATSKEEFVKERQTTKLVRFWDEIRPQPPVPSVSHIMVALFNVAGVYDGVIDTLQFEYVCDEEGACDANICESGKYELDSQCIKDVFGKKAEEEYAKYVR